MVLAAAAVSRGQVVQLPVFHQFQVSTTVSVPDRGTAVLGGVGSSSRGIVGRSVPVVGRLPLAGRPFRRTAIGGGQSFSQMKLGVAILDLEAMDQAVLAEARQQRGQLASGRPASPTPNQDAATIARARFLTAHMGRRGSSRH